MSTKENVIHRATASLKWSAMMEGVARAAQPLVLIVLANLLAREDFGIVGTAMIAISFSRMFLDAGLGKALVQTNAPIEKSANVVFWTNITLGALVYIVIFLGAPFLAEFFNSPQSAPVLRVLGIQILVLSFTSVQQFLFMRDLNFRQLFWAKLAVALTPAFFSIPLAFLGCGVWALVTGTLVGSGLNMAILWLASPWRPSLSFDFAIAARLFRFGFWVILEAFGVWLIAWGDQLLVGKYLSVGELGVYRLAWSISALLFGLLLNPFLPVLYSTLSRLQEDKDKLRSTFDKANRIIIAMACPVGLGLLLTAPEIAHVLFGEKWEGLGFVLGALALLGGGSWLVGANAELYRSIGRPDLNTKLMWAQLFYFLPTYVVAIQYGMKVFVAGRVAAGLLAIPIHIFLYVKVLGASPFYLWQQGKSVFYACAAMALSVSALKVLAGSTMGAVPQPVILAALVLVGAIVYMGMLWILDRDFVLSTKNMLLKALGRASTR